MNTEVIVSITGQVFVFVHDPQADSALFSTELCGPFSFDAEEVQGFSAQGFMYNSGYVGISAV